MAVSQTSLKPVQHHAHPKDEHCPWCDQPIPEDRSEEIHARIAAKEREHSAVIERRLKQDFAREQAQAREQFAREKTQLEAKVKTDAKAESDKIIEQLKKDAAAREAVAREEAKKTAATEMAAKVTAAERGQKAAEDQLKAVVNNHETELVKRLAEQRTALDTDKTDALNAQQSAHFQEQLKLKSKVAELTRQIDRQRSDELGEGAEVNLTDALKQAFPHDRITRINKGEAGADIRHEVFFNGQLCGMILYDSKNRNRWLNDYVTKLRKDQLAAKADHAVLSTAAFPAGQRHLHLQEGVIVINPARAVVLVDLLRRHIVQVHTLRLSNDKREQKTAKLYDFITSDRFAQLLDRFESLADKLQALDVKEKKAHDLTWKNRGELVCGIQRAHADLSSEIERIIGTAAAAAMES